jgi:putative SOS response-associated peptidase YedK
VCGRFTITVSKEELNDYLEDYFSIGWSDHMKLPRYNVAPTQDIATLIFGKGAYRVGPMTWGIHTGHERRSLIINARAETVLEKSLFKPLFAHRRCLILSDGFYEWKRDEKIRQPYRIVLKNRDIFLMAGLYQMGNSTDPRARSVILTTKASAMMSSIHDRMPVILTPTAGKTWLDPRSEIHELQALLQSDRTGDMTIYPVSMVVNQATNDTKACIMNIEETQKG